MAGDQCDLGVVVVHVGVDREAKSVSLSFDRSVAWLDLDPDQAILLAKQIISVAKNIKSGKAEAHLVYLAEATDANQ